MYKLRAWTRIIIVTLSLVMASRGYKLYHGHKIVRLTHASGDVEALLNNALLKEMSIVSIQPHRASIDLHVSPERHRNLTRLLTDDSVSHSVLNPDLQRLINLQRRYKRSYSPPDKENFTLNTYHTYEEIEDWLHDIDETCGSRCRLTSIGQSFQNRQIYMMKIGRGRRRRPAVWIDAGIHAREWIGHATALYIINTLVMNGDVDPSVKRLLDAYDWYIVPVANPDGYVYTWTKDRLWRKNLSVAPRSYCVGADLNRNWDYHWNGNGASDDPCQENYRGARAFSEPETRALSAQIMKLNKKIKIYLSLHAYGQYWLTPWGFTYNTPEDYTSLKMLGNVASAAMKQSTGTHYDVGQASRMLYLAAGGSDDWVKGVTGVDYAYTIELRDTGVYGFLLPEGLIECTASEAWEGIKALARGVRGVRARRRRLRSRTH